MNTVPRLSREVFQQSFRDQHQRTLELLQRRPELRDLPSAVGAMVAEAKVSAA